MSRAWCKHIIWSVGPVGDEESYWFNNVHEAHHFEFQFCPLCGTPRPSDPGTLKEKGKYLASRFCVNCGHKGCSTETFGSVASQFETCLTCGTRNWEKAVRIGVGT